MTDPLLNYRFDLYTLHLGDALLALPATRYGDQMSLKPQHRFPGAPVEYVDSPGGLSAIGHPRQQRTESWLAETGREAVRHQLLPPTTKDLIVVAPDVISPQKQWTNWGELLKAIPQAVLLDSKVSRELWMSTLNQAVTVICPDTGTSHMADALGVPKVISLHGIEENWPRYAPYWCRDYCVVKDGMESITIDEILERVND